MPARLEVLHMPVCHPVETCNHSLFWSRLAKVPLYSREGINFADQPPSHIHYRPIENLLNHLILNILIGLQSLLGWCQAN